jgi:hypothetical protein
MAPNCGALQRLRLGIQPQRAQRRHQADGREQHADPEREPPGSHAGGIAQLVVEGADAEPGAGEQVDGARGEVLLVADPGFHGVFLTGG